MRVLRIGVAVAAVATVVGGATLANASTAHHAAAANTTVTISENEYHLLNIPTTLKHGVNYTIVVKNVGKIAHDLLIDDNGLHDRGIHNPSPVAPKHSKSFTVNFPKAGKYHFYCARKGHAALGMTRMITVH